jgi:hypothetical protein
MVTSRTNTEILTLRLALLSQGQNDGETAPFDYAQGQDQDGKTKARTTTEADPLWG